MGVDRVTIFGLIAGQMTNNVLHFYQPDTTDADHIRLAELVRDWWVENPMRLNCDGHMSWNRVHVYDVNSGDPPIDLTFAKTGAGGPTTNFLPFVSAVFRFQTAVGGRRGRGRTYQAGIGQGFYINGLWDASAMTNLNAVAAALKAFWCVPSDVNYKGEGWQLAVCPRGDPSDFHLVTDVVARPLVGSQRRRQLGVGS